MDRFDETRVRRDMREVGDYAGKRISRHVYAHAPSAREMLEAWKDYAASLTKRMEDGLKLAATRSATFSDKHRIYHEVSKLALELARCHMAMSRYTVSHNPSSRNFALNASEMTRSVYAEDLLGISRLRRGEADTTKLAAVVLHLKPERLEKLFTPSRLEKIRLAA